MSEPGQHAATTLVEVAPFAPVRGLYTYRWSGGRQPAPVAAGMRVVVPFGGRRIVGLITQVDVEPPEIDLARLRDVAELLDHEPLLSEDLVGFLLRAARYYFAPEGEIIRAALPASLQAKRRDVVRLTADGRRCLAAQQELLRRAEDDLSRGELAVLDALHARGGAAARQRIEAAESVLAVLVERGLVRRTASRRLQLSPISDLEIEVLEAPDADELLARSPRQAALWARLRRTGGRIRLGQLQPRPRRAKPLLRALERKGLVDLHHVERVRDPFADEPPAEDRVHQLTGHQQRALEALLEGLSARAFRPFLLHGVTGSGKTEVYLRVIARALDQGRAALVLVPEIALTPQLAARFRARFGDAVAVLHSGLSEGERQDQWQQLRSGRVRIALGARSAVFAPLEQLGVIVVDEEHDGSFKQEEGVRYNGRDLALLRGQRSGAVVVLGSATPSLESYQAAERSRFALLELPDRATPRPLPDVSLVDLRRYQPASETMLSAPLAEAVDEVIGRGQQAILFLNRRGFSPFVLCRECGHVFRCEHCSVSLTHHRQRRRLICHYCGYSESVPSRCPTCSSEQIQMRGFGTERIEQALGERFPGATIARLDRDTAARRRRLRALLQRVAAGEVDILVGTQMVTKGHDFPSVTLVGVLCADLGLHFPDFRAGERTFQLLTQVAGRAGRGEAVGRVIIQTYDPQHPAVAAACAHDYGSFFRREIGERRDAGYPPCAHLVALHFDSTEARQVSAAAREVGRRVRGWAEQAGARVLGPAEAPLQRLKGRTRWMLLLKAAARGPVRSVVDRLLRDPPRMPGVRMTIDVDPVQML